MSDTSNGGRENPGGTRDRPLHRLHRSTCVVMVLAAAVMALVNLPGQVVTRINWNTFFPFYAVVGGRLTVFGAAAIEHGWPLSYLTREMPSDWDGATLQSVPQGEFWALWHDVRETSYAAAAADLAIAAAGVLLLGLLFEVWRRRRAKVYQFHVIDLLALVTVAAIVMSCLATVRNEYRREKQAIDAMQGVVFLGANTQQCGGPSWLRGLIGDWPFHIFDRLVSIDASTNNQFYWLQHFRSLQILETDNPNGFAALRGLEKLEYIEFMGGDIGEGQLIYLRNLPRLTGLTLHLDKIGSDTLQDLAALSRLRYLGLIVDKLAAEDFAHLGELRALRFLSLRCSRIEYGDMEQVARLEDLRQLELEGRFIAVQGLGQLVELKHLHSLSVTWDETREDAAPDAGDNSDPFEDRAVGDPAVGRAGVIVASPPRVGNRPTVPSPQKPMKETRDFVFSRELAWLTEMPALRSLSLDGVRIYDDAVEQIGRTKGLECLTLQSDDITDESLKHLRGLTNLKTLDLSDNPLTDAAVEELGQLTSLRQLSLFGTKVTPAGIARIQEMLPDCELNQLPAGMGFF